MSENKNEEKPTLTERESELLIYYIRTADGGLPKADWSKFAEMAGFKNANTASVSFAKVKKKILGTADAGSAKSTPRKPTPGGKRKQSTPKTADDDDDVKETPTKKMKPTPKKGDKKEIVVKGDADGEGNAAFL